ncbi:MAG: hypothetical protein L0Z70_16450 [Chloroflexi bacterium]|nr:hypothetical protein [Chloroflexota bacterium]
MSDLSAFRARIQQVLFDTSAAIWDSAAIDEGLRQALEEYSLYLPLEREAVVELPGDGREVALEALDGLQYVTQAWWPFESAAGERWPPNRLRGFHVYWDDARPVLFLDRFDGNMPRQGEEMRLWYVAGHSIAGLDGGGVTTIPGGHVALLVGAAAAHAAMSRTLDLIETTGADLYGVGLLGAWASRKLREFRERLQVLQRGKARSGLPWGEGWG